MAADGTARLHTSSGRVQPFSMQEGEHASRDRLSMQLDTEPIQPATSTRVPTARARTAASGGTALSARAPTAGGSTRIGTAAARGNPYIIVAITENRAREIGVAHLDLSSLHTVQLHQYADSQTFSQTMALLELMQPSDIVISKSQQDRVVFQKIKQAYEDIASVHSADRKYFDEEKGFEMAKVLTCRPLQHDVQSKYLAIASLYALTKYVEFQQHIVLAHGAMNITVREEASRMAIDFESLKRLEVLRNARTEATKDSLFDVINHTNTSVGARLLRAQPYTDIHTLYPRQNSVEYILRHSALYFTCKAVLDKFVDLDALLTQFAYVPKVSTPRTVRAAIHAVMLLKHTLEQVPRLVAALNDVDDMLLVVLRDHLRADALAAMLTRISVYVNDDAHMTSSAQAMREQECFAVRDGADGTLDAVRALYHDTMNGIKSLVEGYKEEWNKPNLRLTYTATRGYHLHLPLPQGDQAVQAEQAMPPEVIQAVRNKASITCSTEELSSANSRLQECVFNMYVATNAVVGGLLDEIRGNITALFEATKSVATIDLLMSFAGMVIVSPRPEAFTRPSFSEDGPLHIVQGRHPIAERSAPTTFIANDTMMSMDANLLLVTGPNCSGKSTYLRQIGLLVLLAHIGCMIPASSASIRLTDRLCTRMGTSDDMEANASTFLKEMKETAFVLQQANALGDALLADAASGAATASTSAKRGDRVLVLMDELGRGTSNEDGVGIAWAVCEYLLATRAYTIFITHYHELSELTAVYPNARSHSMAVEASSDAKSLTYLYKISEGSSPHQSDYGIQLAELVGLPRVLIEDAKAIKHELVARSAPRPVTAALAAAQRHAAAGKMVTPQRLRTAESQASSALPPQLAALVMSVEQRRMVSDLVARLSVLLSHEITPAKRGIAVEYLRTLYRDYVLPLTRIGVPQLFGHAEAARVPESAARTAVPDTDMRVASRAPSPRTVESDRGFTDTVLMERFTDGGGMSRVGTALTRVGTAIDFDGMPPPARQKTPSVPTTASGVRQSTPLVAPAGTGAGRPLSAIPKQAVKPGTADHRVVTTPAAAPRPATGKLAAAGTRRSRQRLAQLRLERCTMPRQVVPVVLMCVTPRQRVCPVSR